MSEQNNAQTDSGIQDSLSTATKSENEKQNGVQSPVPVEGRADDEHGSEDLTNTSNPKSNGDISKSITDMKLDLSDPDTVIHMLETVNLNEEDTEGLLQEAYNMNRKLKEILRCQEKDDAEKASSVSKSKPKSKLRARQQQDSSTSSTNSSESGSRVGSSFGARKILPPIMGEKETSVYAIKLKRSKTNIVDTRGTSSCTAVSRSKSKKESVSPTRHRKTGPRPEWNDRFNYT